MIKYPLYLALAAFAAAAVLLLAPHSPEPPITTTATDAPPGARPVSGFVPARSGYYDTVWPSEHADLWRSHAALAAGLPADFNPAALEVRTARLNLPSWGYTRNPDQVFVIGGSPFVLARFTEAIRSGNSRAGVGSAVRDILNRSVPYLAKVDPHTMAVRFAWMDRGSTVNYTGGAVMHQNGYVYAVSRSVIYKINPAGMQIEASAGLPLAGSRWLTQYWTTYNGLQVLASGELIVKGFDLLDSVNVPGWLLMIDPNTLRVDVRQSAAVSSARLTIQQEPNGAAYLYHVNALDSFRFSLSPAGFRADGNWRAGYRQPRDGSTQASSPLLFGKLGQIAFANNTAPGATVPIRLFTQNTARPSQGVVASQPAFTKETAAYNFFMIAGDPFLSQLVVYYDPIHSLLSARRLAADGALTPVWESASYKVSASPAIVSDRDLLYIDDYRNGRDWFIVLRLSTGKQIAALELEARLPTIGTIFPGMNHDVYLLSTEAGTSNGLISRVFAP